jgi:uncharacterized protein
VIFTNVIKPTHICNLACTYCYNDDVRDPIMRDETLDRVVSQTFDFAERSVPDRVVNFIWHGGEPMVPGLRFYRKVVSLQKRYGRNIPFSNSIQTNGILVDENWIDFFKKHKFKVSISIDGPKALHDRYRVDARRRGSFDRVFRAIEKVQCAGIPLGVCVVISRANVDQVSEIYEFLASRQLPFNIIPLNRSGGGREHFDDVGLAAEEYAPAWIEMFDRWFDADEDYVYCSDFIFKTRAILAGRPADCIGLANCADTNISVDPVGDVFPCATLSGHDDTLYGNLVTEDLQSIMTRSPAIRFRHREVDEQCSTCKWQHVCHGGCPGRSYKFHGDFDKRDYYCPSLYAIYEHIESRVSECSLAAASPHPSHTGELPENRYG